MALFPEIKPKIQDFIARQHIFFVATAPTEGRINLSPKGMDSFRVLGPNRVLWLNVTGSGNETSAHVQENGRMTIMFTAFESKPLILRLYGTAQVIHPTDPEWDERIAHFTPLPGTRQLFEVHVDLVQTSCGTGVPLFDYAGDREQLNDWAVEKGPAGIRQYWAERNQESLDGRPIRILEPHP